MTRGTVLRRDRCQAPAEDECAERSAAATTDKKLTSAGTFWMAGVNYLVCGPYGLQQVLLVIEGDQITVTDLEGEILIEHTRHAPGVPYVGERQTSRAPGPAKTSPLS